MSYREEFKQYVIKAVVRRVGISADKATCLVEKSSLGALLNSNADFIVYKGADYWADKIVAGTL